MSSLFQDELHRPNNRQPTESQEIYEGNLNRITVLNERDNATKL